MLMRTDSMNRIQIQSRIRTRRCPSGDVVGSPRTRRTRMAAPGMGNDSESTRTSVYPDLSPLDRELTVRTAGAVQDPT